MLFMPETPRTTTVATLTMTAKTVAISFPERHDAFREIVKSRFFQWDYGTSRWQHTINPVRHGEPRDRAIEMACRLLSARFSVEAADELHAAILSGAYTPEHTRWVTAYSGDHYHEWFKLIWHRPDDLYRAAMRLAGARYASPAVAVPGNSFNEVLDFADRYDFRLAAEAELLIAEQRQRIAGAVRITMAPPIQPEPIRSRLKPEKLTVPEHVEVDDDLLD